MTKALSVIMPIYNEEDLILNSIETNLSILSGSGLDYELILVNDGSTDNTEKVIQQHFSFDNRLVYHKKENGGFGSAVSRGISLARKENIVFMSVDSPFTPEVFEAFASQIGTTDVLVAYRRKRLGYTARMHLNSWLFHKMVRLLFGLRLRDYNWVHLYKKHIFDTISIEYNGIFMLAEVLIKAKRKGFSIAEFPVDMIKRSGGVATAGSWKVAFRTLGDLLDFYFSKR